MRIGEVLSEEQKKDIPHVDDSSPLEEGGDGSGLEVRHRLGLPDNSEKRRKHFLKPASSEAFTFEKDRLYEGDFFNPYIDFSSTFLAFSLVVNSIDPANFHTEFALQLPGFSIKVIKYINDRTHNLRYVFKNRKTEEVYFVVVITLLFGEELKQALREDKERSRSTSKDSMLGGEPEGVPMQTKSSEEMDGDESPAQEFHDAKSFSVLGADMA